MMERRWENIDLAKRVDTFPDPVLDPDGHKAAMAGFYTVVWPGADGSETALGYMRRDVCDRLLQVPEALRGEVRLDAANNTVSVFQWPGEGLDEPERTRRVAAVAQHLREAAAFPILVKGWRDELWPVFGPSSSSSSSGSDDGELIFSMERAALGLIGSMRYGVHVNAYVVAPDAPHGIRVWVPTRAATKSSFSGMLDNAVGGGLMTGEDPFECMVREADEEASLPEAVVRARATAAGALTYVYVTDARSGEEGHVYPECEWMYDLELPEGTTPRPKDGEVESFALMDVPDVQANLAAGRFKPNCAAVTLDFFIRRGIINRSNEPCYDDIVRHLHRVIPFPGPHRRFELREGAGAEAASQTV
ncbi:hypothetical protein RB595_001960 [Gaeumannomyces hyphopodioides]